MSNRIHKTLVVAYLLAAMALAVYLSPLFDPPACADDQVITENCFPPEPSYR